MKANELMIGDWVRPLRKEIGDKPCRVITMDGGSDLGWIDRNDFSGPVPLSQVERIPLTAEILEKNGWIQTSKRDDERGTMEKWFLPNIAYAYCFSNNEIEFEIIGYGKSSHGRGKYRGILSSVHELQHALRICGIDKEITI